MKAGSLDREIEIKRLVETVDDYGRPSRAWCVLHRLRARKAEQPGREWLTNGASFDEQRAIFTTRYVDQCTLMALAPGESFLPSPDDELVSEGRTYRIVSVQEIGRREGLEIATVIRSA